MLAKIESVALIGTEGHLVEVEVHVATGVPRFTIVGLPHASVREAEQRVRSALLSSEQRWPPARIVANLAPGALRKEGTHFDLALALGVLAGDEAISSSSLAGWVAMGEVALDGNLRPVRGVLGAALACRAAGRKGLICPFHNAAEARLVEDIEVVALESMRDCVAWARGELVPPRVAPASPRKPSSTADLADIRGQVLSRRALEIAAAGGHNLLLCGPPGSGKTMLASRMPSILPRMSRDESLEVTRVHSVAGLLASSAGLISERPFRSPHHHLSVPGLVGGGSGLARPGEVSLAHCGVLFLDEIALYRSEVLESLRTPLEEGVVRIARSGGAVTYPCRISLVAAMNPCRCGYAGDRGGRCRCDSRSLAAYRARLSGPLVDRFDVQVSVPRLTRSELFDQPPGESSIDVRVRVEKARGRQTERYGDPGTTNASAVGTLERLMTLSGPARDLLEVAIDANELTARGVERTMRVARTIADLAEHESILPEDICEALGLRLKRMFPVEAA